MSSKLLLLKVILLVLLSKLSSSFKPRCSRLLKASLSSREKLFEAAVVKEADTFNADEFKLKVKPKSDKEGEAKDHIVEAKLTRVGLKECLSKEGDLRYNTKR